MKSIPGQEDLEHIRVRYPDANIEILAKSGKHLSEQIQDSQSFRYGLINIGADSFDHLEEKFEECRSMLPFEFANASATDQN